jgi:hypothetical protein
MLVRLRGAHLVFRKPLCIFFRGCLADRVVWLRSTRGARVRVWWGSFVYCRNRYAVGSTCEWVCDCRGYVTAALAL